MNNKEKEQDVTKFEFLLTLQGNIICQRYFNVKDYNPDATRSLDIYEYIKNISEDIREDLKIKTSDYLCQNQDYFLDNEVVEDEDVAEKENFLIELKLDNHVFMSRIFPAHFYHPKVRYTVDIRPKLKTILSKLTDILSSKNLVTNYLEYDLLKD